MRYLHVIAFLMVLLGIIGCQDGSIVYVDGRSIVHLVLQNGGRRFDVDTHASAVHRYSVLAVSNDCVCLSSSDIGPRMYFVDKADRIGVLPALYATHGDYEVYVVYNIKVKGNESAYRRISDGLTIICSSCDRVGIKKIEGKYRYSREAVRVYEDSGIQIEGDKVVKFSELIAEPIAER